MGEQASLSPFPLYTWQLVKTQSRVEQLEHELKRAEVSHALCTAYKHDDSFTDL